MKALNVVATAYRATLEEQDDTIVWLTHAMKGAGAEVDLLLRGAAVNYVVRDQGVEPLRLGTRCQAHSPQIAGEVGKLIEKGVRVFVLREDQRRYGLGDVPLLDRVEPVASSGLPDLFAGYDRVFHW